MCNQCWLGTRDFKASHLYNMGKWCEHCREHYPASHYINGKHAVGHKYGPTGAALLAVRIVRALAATDGPVAYDEMNGEARCLLCGVAGRGKDSPSFLVEDTHDPNCSWRLAREWVQHQEQSYRNA
jgi:hypothetical protein